MKGEKLQPSAPQKAAGGCALFEGVLPVLRPLCYDGSNCPTFPCQPEADKGSVDQLPIGSEDKGVLVTHPGLEVIAPALFFNRVPVVAEATRPVRNAFDHEHRSHRPFSGIASLLPSTSANL
jgi:hypothetical protein